MDLKAVPTLLRGFRRAFGLTDLGGVERLSDSLSPTFDIWRHIEHRVLRGELSGSATISVGAGGAGLRSMVQLYNPSGSGRLVVLEKACAAAAAYVSIDQLAIGSLMNAQNGLRDLRTKRIWTTDYDPQLIAQVRADSGAAFPGTSYLRWRLPANRESDLEFVLAEGTGVAFDPGADNTALAVWFAWRERDLLTGERRTELW